MKVFAISGYSGAGKTTLIEKLIAHFVHSGLRVAALKHAHKGFDLDVPGKDSYRLRAAGATQVLISSPTRWALMEELGNAAEPSLLDHLQRLLNSDAAPDLVLVEGWKKSVLPKLEVHRVATKLPLQCLEDTRITGVASDTYLDDIKAKIQVLSLNDVTAIAEFVLKHAVTVPQITALETVEMQQQSQQQQ